MSLFTGGMLNIKMLQEFPGSSPHQVDGVLLSTSITYCRPQVAWVTVAGWSVSLAASPALTHLCRNHSVRLVAVIGTQAGHGRRLSLPGPLLNAAVKKHS